MKSLLMKTPARSNKALNSMRAGATRRIGAARQAAVTGCISTLLAISATAQIPVGAGSQFCEQYLQSCQKKSPENTTRRSMIVSWVQGYLIGSAETITRERIVPEIADRIARGELPPDLDLVLSDPQGRLLTTLQAKFGTHSGWVFDPPDAKTIEARLADYCRDHPSNRISEAAATFATELEERAKRK